MTERPVISARPSTKEWIKVIECYQETLGFASELKKTALFSSALIKLLFDLPLLEHHNIRPFGVNSLFLEPEDRDIDQKDDNSRLDYKIPRLMIVDDGIDQ